MGILIVFVSDSLMFG